MKYYYTIVFTLLSCLSICDATLLWRINIDPPAYLLGTVHLPYNEIWSSLSNTAKSAFNNCTHFSPEFDMTNFFLYSRFRMCIDTPIVPIANGLPPLPPAFMGAPTLQTPVLDVYLSSEARRTRKNIASLESIEMYCEFTKFQIASLTKNFTAPVDASSLPNPNENEQIKRLYNCDFNQYEEFFVTQPTLKTVDQTLLGFQQNLEEIVSRRDSNMAKKINSILEGASPNDRFFFAVGYIHLMNPKGIIGKLRQDYKYSITRLCSDPLNFRSKLECQGPSWCDTKSRL